MAAKEITTRLAVSLLCGVAFFFLYAFAVGAVIRHLARDSAARFVITLPLTWPTGVYYALPLYPHAEGPALLFITFIPNVVFYSLLAFAFLTWSSSRRLRLS
jgi:hypothetical protein